ncbi:hypothetical protein D9758_017167 [Tetrapyrgos nigripes]|uniref:Uncharacterized protein n=1 Tax=Tetrapyrgos nigripes TaxID=182062 RepID=A0A8H5FHY5_9AGAR|nr:hypothetical protein D9758_017167 [Tetrapyrgos nigripes]
MLRVYKSFYELGVTELYRSIRITSFSGLAKLSKTRGLVHKEARIECPCLLVEFYMWISWAPPHFNIINIFQAIQNVKKLTLYAEGYHLPWTDVLLPQNITPLQYNNLLSIPDKGGYARHGQAAAAAILNGQISLPSLQSYRGPLLILQSFVKSTPALSSIMLDLLEDGEDSIPLLPKLSALEREESSLLGVNSPFLSLEVMISSSVQGNILRELIPKLPKRLQTLSRRVFYNTATPPIVISYPL